MRNTTKFIRTHEIMDGHLTLLFNLLFATGDKDSEQIPYGIANYGREDLEQLWELATSHHVILRAFPGLHRAMIAEGNGQAEWVENAMGTERARIDKALAFLSPICEALGDIGEVVVIKSLDHWPDLGNDLDLYTTARGTDVVAVLRERFQARVSERSWGDRLANKWNFIVPGLPELVEVHVRRLGQTGEQVAITNSLVARAGAAQFGPHTFRVPAAEDRIMISTLQRMYRHFYLRLCDIVDTARLIDSGTIDYEYLQTLAQSAGLWDGMSSYLVIVGNYVESYRGEGLALPFEVTSAARFDNANVGFRKAFLRIPIFPEAASLYAKEWKKLFLRGELQNILRLSLLPGLAVAAALSSKITGSDKGIW
jgi:hypothetical protein